jgi:gliding motility-associated-like protein
MKFPTVMKNFLLVFFLITSAILFAQPVNLFQQFNGRLDFTAFGNTLNEFPNNGPNGNCTLLLSSNATLNLTSGQTFVSAHMYWASVGTGDFDVALNGIPISADRVFSHTFNGLPYFAAYTDVTNIVAAAGNGTYTFSDLDVTGVIGNYCGTDFGGWAIYVIYSDPSLRLNQISLFDGLESVSASNNTLDITLTNIDVTSDILSKIGFLAWEGEAEIANNESLLINGILIDNPPLNPGDNIFNGTNTYTGSNMLYNMDLDYYDLMGIVQPGDTSVFIQLTSSQDFVMVNNIITSVNSELSDATIVIDDVGVLCENNNMDVEYTVYNVNSTAPLALNTPIAFYADAILIGQTQTVADIPIGGSESGLITLNIPVGTPTIFNLRAVVDDIGNGTGVVDETDETNNEFSMVIDLSTAGIFFGNNIEACFGSAVVLDTGLTKPPFNFEWFESGVTIPGATGPTLNVVADGIYSVVAQDGICRVTSTPVLVHFNPQPIAFPPVDLFQCDYGTTSGVFDLTVNDANILGPQDPTMFNIKYYETLIDSQNDTNPILGPTVHLIVPPSPQTIYVRIEDLSGTCFDLEQFRIYFSRAIAGDVPLNYSLCDVDQNGGELIDLFTEFNALVLDGEPSSSYNISYHGSQADADANLNPHPNPYFVTAPSEIVYIRLENRDDTTCFDTMKNINIIVDTLPVINNMPPTLVLCDPNNDGFAEFDLTQQTTVITLGDPTLAVTYHGTLTDAENGALPLPNPYTNDQIYLDAPITDITDPLYGTGGVWARVQSTVNSCYAVVSFALEVRWAPVATTPAEPLRQCDDSVPDGFTFFDLTVVEPEVLGGLSPSEFDIYYYEDMNEAVLAGDNALNSPDFSQAIPTPTAFLNSMNPQVIYILVVGNSTSTIPPNPNSGEGCYDIVELTLIVDPIPEDLGPFEIMLCDDDLNGSTLDDEISTFDLTSQNILVNGGDPTIIVTWYETAADEMADIPIPDPTMYQNFATPQTVIGRATSEFGCRNTVTLTLTVLPNPNPKTDPTPLELCDDDDDGLVGGFDPSLRDVEIIDGEANVSVLYYELLSDAMLGIPGTEITAPYTNIVPYSQIIFARVTKDVPPNAVACYSIVELELVVIPLPDMPDSTFEDPFIGCDESGNGQAIFDLTLQDAAVLGVQNPADFVLPITYYEMLVDANAGTNAINPANAFLSGGQPIWVRLESLVTGCVRITEFQIEVGIFPIIGAGDDLFLCDDEINGSTLTDGLSTFDLTVNTPLIDLGDTTLTVQYYATAADQNNDIPITTPEAYQNIISPQQQIFVSVFSTQGCEATSQFYINVEPNPVAVTPAPLIACDPNNDGFAEFDLSSVTNIITNNDVNLSVTYHGTLTEAENDGIQLPNLYVNDDIYNDIPVTDPTDPLYGTGGVWARVETTLNSCYTIVPFALEVRSAPVATAPEPLHQCDDAVADGFTLFDLTVVEPEVLGTLSPTEYDIYFYEDILDAMTAGDLALTAPDFSLAISTPMSYLNTSNPQDIYVLVVGNSTSTIPPNPNSGEGCYDIVTLTLIVDLVPMDLGPFEMMLCDDELNGSTSDDEISTFDLTTQDVNVNGGDPSITVLWFETLADEAANIPIPDPTMYQNFASPQTVFGRATSEFDCSTIVTLTLTVLPNPNPNTEPDPLELCDDDDDGLVGGFDLTLADMQIINSEPDVSVLYYEDLAVAMIGLPGTEIVGPYTNIVPYSQIIYARVTKDVPPATIACFTIVELELIVIPKPDMPDATFQDPFIACDENGNGEAIFDLTLQDAAVLGVQDPSEFLPITYYTLQADADAGINAIGIPNAFPSTGQTIWVRLESLVTTCYRVSQFEIEVGLFPVIGVGDDLSLCDDEINGSTSTDGLSTFDLTVNTPVIDLGDPTLTVIYYATAADQANDIAIITPEAYQNIISPQQEIFVSVFSGQSCEAINSFFINVNPNPSSVTPTPFVVCDVNNDGFANFTLTDKTAEIVNGEPGVDVSYFETLVDAQNNVFELTSPYGNIVANMQTIYARAHFDDPPAGSGCFTIVEVLLVVSPTPLMPANLPDLTICDDVGFGIFDLTVQDELIYGTQDPTAYTISYHTSLADAEAGSNPIPNPEAYPNTSSPQPIFARLTDNVSGCFKIRDFELLVSIGPAVNQPDPLSMCDDLGEPNDGITAFDLTVKNDEITGGAPGVGVRYYETQLDAENDENRINPETAYFNTSNPQTIYVRVIDGNTECFNTTLTLRLRVTPNPTPVSPAAIEACDDNDPGDGIEVFDLTQREGEILNGETWHIAYYELLELAIAGDLTTSIQIPNAYANTANPQIIYVRVTGDIMNVDSCFEIVELELIVNPLPDDSAMPEPFAICEINSNGIAVFDLTTKIDEILNGQDPGIFEVSFYTDALEAENKMNPIVNPDTFSNTVNPQIIYTGIENLETMCYIGGTQFFELQVLEGATATTPAAPYTLCDIIGENDGYTEFDLSAGNTDLYSEILGGQTTPPYNLDFYQTLEEAEAGDLNTALPSPYTNIINPQIIYARVTNSDTECYDVVEVILNVEQLPVINLEEEYRLCVDINGNPIAEEEGAMSPPLIDTGLDPNLYDITWVYPGGTAIGPSIVALEPGTYTVTYCEPTIGGCCIEQSVNVIVSQPPVLYDAVLVNGAFSDVHIIQATAEGLSDQYVFQLDNGPFIDSGTFENVSAGGHTVTIKDANGCGSVTIEIGVIDYPRFMTPNQDGFHDTWNIIGIAQFDPTAKIYIFDRFGKLLKQLSPLGNGWNGTYKGNPLPSSDYWFVVEYTEEGVQKEFKGHFTLKR